MTILEQIEEISKKIKELSGQIEEISGNMCDDYCRFQREYFEKYGDSDEAIEKLWEEKCDSCPLMRLL